jgi:glucose/arabinose dehydrogenase
MTNNGMELRGTRPVMDDPDALLRVISNTWYGWPDYSADLFPISDARFQPRWQELLIRSGYPDLSFVVDHATSGLIPPDRTALLAATFQPLSGAAKLAFVPGTGPFSQYAGNAIVALSGDRAPFATSGKPLVGPLGYKVVRVDVGENQVVDFVRNTVGGPLSRVRGASVGLERPVDVKFGPDGAMYILDMGRMSVESGQPRISPGTGRVFRLEASSVAPLEADVQR